MLSTFRNLRAADRLLRAQEQGATLSDSSSDLVEDVDSQPDSVDLQDYRERLR